MLHGNKNVPVVLKFTENLPKFICTSLFTRQVGVSIATRETVYKLKLLFSKF